MSKSSQLTLGKWSPKGCGGILLFNDGQEVVSRLTVAHAILYPHVLNLTPKSKPPYKSVTYKYDGGILQDDGQWFVHKDFVHGGLNIALWVKHPSMLSDTIADWGKTAREVPTISHHAEVYVTGVTLTTLGGALSRTRTANS